MSARRRPDRNPDRAPRATSTRTPLHGLWSAAVRARIALLVVAVLAILPYAQSVSYDFARDDHDLIRNNGALRGNAPLHTLLVSDFTAASAGQSGKWRPAVTLANWLDGQVGAWSPGAFHRTNVFVHVLACVVFALLLALLGLPVVAVVLGAAWFAVMPAHVESVAWISGRTDLMAVLFVLLALAFDEARRLAKSRWPGWVAPACYAFALLSKEVSVAFLPIVATLAAVRTPRFEIRSWARWLAPYVGVTVLWAVAWAVIVTLPEANATVVAAGRASAIAMIGPLLAFAWPWALRAPDLMMPSGSGVIVATGVAIHVAFLALWVWSALRRSTWAVVLACVWFPLLVPTLLGVWRGETVFAERLMMLPTIGIAWALALALAAVERRSFARVAQVVGVLVIVASLVQTWRYVPVWQNDATLFAAVYEAQPENPIGPLGLAGVALAEGRVDDALDYITRAERVDPSVPEIHQYRAEIAFSRREWGDVVAHANRTLALDPGRAYPRILRAAARVRSDSLDAAEAELRELVPRRGGDPLVAGAWGELLLRRDRGEDAESYLRLAASRSPRDPRLQALHGMSLIASGRSDEARAAFERATVLDPGAYEAWLSLAMLHHMAWRLEDRNAALARAEALPQAADGRAQALREEWSDTSP